MAPRADRRRSDAGTSFVELLVAMVILSIIVATTVTLANGFERSNAENMARQDQIDSARAAVERMSKTLRSAVKPSQLTGVYTLEGDSTVDAFVTGEKFRVQFYTNLDNSGNAVGPSRVTYVVGTSGVGLGVLTEKVQTPMSATPGPTGYVFCDAEASGAPASCTTHLTTRQLARGVIVDPTKPVFRYFNDDSDEMLPAAGGQLTAAQLDVVLSIEITMTVQSTGATKPQPTTYVQRLMMPNVEALLRSEDDDE